MVGRRGARVHVHLPLPSDCPPRPPGSDRPPLVGVYIGVHWQKIRIRATCSHTDYVAAEIGIPLCALLIFSTYLRDVPNPQQYGGLPRVYQIKFNPHLMLLIEVAFTAPFSSRLQHAHIGRQGCGVR